VSFVVNAFAEECPVSAGFGHSIPQADIKLRTPEALIIERKHLAPVRLGGMLAAGFLIAL
jgi:hypothetical protein